MAVLVLGTLPDEPLLPAVVLVKDAPDEVAERVNDMSVRTILVTLQDGEEWWVRADAIVIIQPDPPAERYD
jgi:hypothetical protein